MINLLLKNFAISNYQHWNGPAKYGLTIETESQIQESINKILEQNNVTVIAIAHRLSTIKHMDRIVVMNDGRIIEDGDFASLIAKDGGKFKELWDHQINTMAQTQQPILFT